MRRIGAFSCTALIVSSVLAVATPASVAQAAPTCLNSTANPEALGQLESALAEKSNQSDVELKETLGVTRVDGNGVAVDPGAEDGGSDVVPDPGVDESDEATVGGSANELNLSPPKFYTITDCSHVVHRYVQADFHFQGRWPDGAKRRRYDGLPGTYKVGGTEGFGIAFSNPVVVESATLRTCDHEVDGQRFGCGGVVDVWDVNSYGAAWRFQDRAWYDSNGLRDDDWGINNGNGRIVFKYRPRVAGCLQAFSKYVHTWDSSSITGIGVGRSEISVQWQNSEQAWQKAIWSSPC